MPSYGIGNPVVKIKWSHGRLFFIMGTSYTKKLQTHKRLQYLLVVILFPTEYKRWRTEYMNQIPHVFFSTDWRHGEHRYCTVLDNILMDQTVSRKHHGIGMLSACRPYIMRAISSRSLVDSPTKAIIAKFWCLFMLAQVNSWTNIPVAGEISWCPYSWAVIVMYRQASNISRTLVGILPDDNTEYTPGDIRIFSQLHPPLLIN